MNTPAFVCSFLLMLTMPLAGHAVEGTSVPNPTKKGSFHPQLATLLAGQHLIDAKGDPVPVDRLLTKKYVFVYFSGYYCHPCRLITPRLINFYHEQAPKGDFEVLFCDDFDHNAATMQKYLREAKMPWPALRYNDPAVAGLVALVKKSPGVPYLYLLDEQDAVVGQPTKSENDHRSLFPVNVWLSLHGQPQNHWDFREAMAKASETAH